tara:strand:- start:11544 stop:12665 length:1122 start_codon:yes stop_codon:yes gene_type:complete
MNELNFSSISDLKKILADNKINKILVICGKTSFEKSGAKKIFKDLLKIKQTYYFHKNFAYPDISELKKIIIKIKEFSPDFIIAVGGGSVLDYAKIANVLFDSKNIEEAVTQSNYRIQKKFTKLIAIPTTAGSGAEVTTNAVIYINKMKYSVEGELLRPDYFFLIPELVIGASQKIKSSAGFDAISQAIESIISKKSNNKSLNFAKKSLEISLKNYLNYIKNPNTENTLAMCIAANLAGEAISISKTTAPHAVSYPFTSYFNVSHGHAVSLTLNEFLLFNYENKKIASCDFNLEERYKLIFNLTRTNNINELNMYLKVLKEKANLTDDFKKLGINISDHLNTLLSNINVQRLKNNPINLQVDDIKNILLKKNNS